MSRYIQSINNQIQTYFKSWVNQVSSDSRDDINIISKLKKPVALNLVSKLVGFSIPFATRNGFKVIDFKTGYVKAFIPLKPNKNHINTMYAGALFTVAELPGGIISMLNFNEDYYPILKDLKMDFIKVAKSDVTVEFEISKRELQRIEKEAFNTGKSNFVLEGELKNESGQVVAKSFANYQLRKH